LISKILVGRKTSLVVENADASSFGEGQAPHPRDGIFGTDTRIIGAPDIHADLSLTANSNALVTANICL
jgi:hypothetical protein